MIDTPLGIGAMFLAGMIAAAVNSIAGGGTLVSFPTLLALGLPEKIANATNAVALWPGSLAGAFGFREHLKDARAELKLLLPPTIVGSLLGSVLLVVTPESIFKVLVPFLILVATLLLAFQPQIKKKVAETGFALSPFWVATLQFLVALYGGYFGAGMGIMMLAIMSLYIHDDMHRMNAIKNWLAVVINFGASVLLISQRLVSLVPALALMTGALIGGYVSARIAQKVKSETLRKVVVAYGLVMTGVLMVRLWM